MDLNKLTTKSQEALRNSQELAIIRNQQQVDVFHLLYALITQENSVVPMIFQKMEINLKKIKEDILSQVENYPKMADSSLAQIFIAPEMIIVLNSVG